MTILVLGSINLDLTTYVPRLPQARVLLLQLETPLATSLAAARAARQRGLSVVLDPAPVRTLPDEAYQLATVLTPNETETPCALPPLRAHWRRPNMGRRPPCPIAMN